MKQVIVVNTSLNMSPGKLAAQVAHASVANVMSNPKYVKVIQWMEDGMSKIILQGKDETELFQLQERANLKGIKAFLIRDAGRTELEPGSVTALSIGPDEDHTINQVTGHLKLL